MPIGRLAVRRASWLLPLAAAVVAHAVHAAGGIDVNCGRQLFVDDYLVESSDGLVRHWNAPVKIESPIVWSGSIPKQASGSAANGGPVNLACATDGGLWWDPTRKKFRLWYQAGWCGDICYAESTDGLEWDFPDLGIVPGTDDCKAFAGADSTKTELRFARGYVAAGGPAYSGLRDI